MKILGTDFVAYLVTDLDRAVAFYRDVLELPMEVYKKEWNWAEFNCGNLTLTLYAGVQLPEVVLGGRIGLAVADVQAAYSELQQKNVRILKPPYELSYCWHLEILDPDGNMIIIHQRKDGTVGQETQPRCSQT